jgi:hypothetical protein
MAAPVAATSNHETKELEMAEALEVEVEVDPSESASLRGQNSQQRDKVEASGVVEESGAAGGNDGTQQ